MASGVPYPEDVESRIRSRVAVMAALGTAGYRSADEEQIGYVRSNWPIQVSLADFYRSEEKASGQPGVFELSATISTAANKGKSP